jgi:hypothetical protein
VKALAIIDLPSPSEVAEVHVPKDARPVAVIVNVHSARPAILAEVNPLTTESVGKVMWHLHTVLPGRPQSQAPDAAEFVGVVSFQAGPDPEDIVHVAGYVERNRKPASMLYVAGNGGAHA